MCFLHPQKWPALVRLAIWLMVTTVLGQEIGGVQTTIASTPAPVAPPVTPPSLFGIVGGGSVELGQQVVLSVSFWQQGQDLTYQWKKGGMDISGATLSSYLITAAVAADSGTYNVTVTNSAGSSVASTDLTVKPAAAPVITAPPANLVRQVGQTAEFSYLATGSFPRTHQWRRNGTDIPGATDSFYRIAAVTLNDSATYAVVVTNSLGMATSASASLTVNAATPVVLASNSPSDVTTVQGSSASFSAGVTNGSQPITYQWRKNGVPIPGTDLSQLSFGAVAMSDAGKYSVTVTNPAGATTSREATLTVTAPIPVTIRSHPRDQTIYEGQDASFSVDAQGSYPVSYQWSKNGSPITGATNYFYSVSRASRSDAGTYAVTVTNAAGPVTSNGAILTVNAAVAPTISQQPQGQTLNYGDTLNLSANVNGTSPFSYQWKKDGVALSNATGSGYYFYSATPANSGVYTVVVTNAAGTVTSNEAVITVKAAVAPAITRQPQSQTVAYGSSLDLSVQVTGSPALSFQWKKDGVALQSGTYSGYSVYNVTTFDSGVYTVVISNSAGAVTSQGATVTVQAAIAPTIIEQPRSDTVAYGTYVSLSVRTEGSPPLTYQWKKDGVSLGSSGASNYLSLGSTTPAASGSYVVVVTNPAGSVTSSAAVLTVNPAAVPAIITQPKSQEIAVGLPFSLNADVNSVGVGSLNFQWEKDNVAIAGAIYSYFSINAVSAADAGDYALVITGPGGAVTSQNAKLTVLPPVPPTVSSWPYPESSTTIGGSVSLSVYSVSGSPPFSYQWAKDGVALPHATASSLNLQPVTENELGIYTLTISNVAGLITSPPIRVRLSRDADQTSRPWMDAGRVNDVVYFLATSPSRIERYDLAAERWLPSVILSETAMPTAFAPASEGIYIAYGRSLVRRTLDLTGETQVINSPVNVTRLFGFDAWLYYNSTEGGGYGMVRRSTLQPEGDAGAALSGGMAIAGTLRKAFGRDYWDLLSVKVGTDGKFSAVTDAGYYYVFPSASRTYVFPDEQLLADDSGVVYRTSDMTYGGSLGEGFDDLAFLSDRTPVVLRRNALSIVAPDTLFEVGRVTLASPAFRVFTRGTDAFVFGAAPSGGGLTAAKVTRARYLPPTVSGPAEPPAGRYSIDDAYLSDDGVVHVFSRTLQSILRWSTSTRAFLPGIPLRAAPVLTFQQPGLKRALFAYVDGVVTAVPVTGDTAAERQIGSLTNRLFGVTDLGSMVLLHIYHGSDSGERRLVLGADGQPLFLSGWSYWGLGLAYEPVTHRLFSKGRFSIAAVEYETVPDSGLLPAGTNQVSNPAQNIEPPLRFNPEGTLVAAGNGRVLNSDLAQMGTLANKILDAAWLPDGLYTLRTHSGETEVQQWARVSYLLTRSVTLRGTPVRIFRLSDTQLVVVTALQGIAAFTVLNSDLTVSTSPVAKITASTSPAVQSASPGGTVKLTSSISAAAGSITYRWLQNGSAVAGATEAWLTLPNVQPVNAGLYSTMVTGADGSVTTAPCILGLATTSKVIGAGLEIGKNIRHANGNVYDQVLLQGLAASVTADADQVLRMSYVDLNDDIVQVEFSGAGTLSLVLTGASGPAAPLNYNQPDVNYLKGHATLVITGANETTNVSVFSVGRVTATNQALFRPDVTYDGIADLACIAIVSSNGKFGGLRAANANFFNSSGPIGLYAPGVQFTGPVYIGNIDAFGDATPMLVMDSAADIRITGGDLQQTNSRAVKVKGLFQLKFTEGSTSHGGSLPAQTNRARFDRDGSDVTAQIAIANPSP